MVIIQAMIIALLGWIVVQNTDLDRLGMELRRANGALLIAAVIPLIAERLIRPYRLATLLGTSSSLPIVAAQSVSQLVNLILPLRSGEMLLIFILRSLTPIAGSFALSIVIIDRLLDILFVMIVFSFATAVVPVLPEIVNQSALVLGVGCIFVIMLLLILVATRASAIISFDRWCSRFTGKRGERWVRRIEHIINGLTVLLDFRRMAIAIVATAVTWILATVAAWLVLLSVWQTAPLGAAALAVCFGVIGVTLVSVPAGVGVSHVAFALGAGMFGAPQELSLAFAILAHALTTCTTALMGIIGIPVIRYFGVTIWPRRMK